MKKLQKFRLETAKLQLVCIVDCEMKRGISKFKISLCRTQNWKSSWYIFWNTSKNISLHILATRDTSPCFLLSWHKYHSNNGQLVFSFSVYWFCRCFFVVQIRGLILGDYRVLCFLVFCMFLSPTLTNFSISYLVAGEWCLW